MATATLTYDDVRFSATGDPQWIGEMIQMVLAARAAWIASRNR